MTTTYLETAYLPLGQLKRYPGNPRIGKPGVILDSLRTNGQYRSVIVRRTPGGLVILAGNHTHEAAALHGPVPCGVTVPQADGTRKSCQFCAGHPGDGDPQLRSELVECDDVTAARINLVDNRAAELGDYDGAALAEVMRQVAAEGSLVGTGWDDADLDDLLVRLDREASREVEEIVPYQESTVVTNDDDTEREARLRSHGGQESQRMESRGVRDIILALPAADADELGKLIMRLREDYGALSQGEILLRAARAAVLAPNVDAVRLRVEQVTTRISHLPRAKADSQLASLLRSLSDELALREPEDNDDAETADAPE